MSTTVTYKGNTLTTVDNQTKVLETKGTWLEDDITLVDETSGGSTQVVTVTEETLPGGGVAKHINAVDISDTTAKAADVAQGKYFYTAQGVKTEGTASGGGGGGVAPSEWVRPSDWPDLSKMDVSAGNVIYMTSYADEARGFCYFTITSTGGYTVEIGNISGSTFTTEETYTYNSNSPCYLYYGSINGTYKVLRVTGTAITALTFNGSAAITIGNFKGYNGNQGILDIVGKLPSCTKIYFSSITNIVNVKITDIVLNGNMNSMFSNCYSLTSLDVSKWDTSAVTSMNSMFTNCYSLTSLDVSKWDTSAVINMNGMFTGCNSLISLDVSKWNTSAVTNMNSMFYGCNSLTSLEVSGWDTSAVTNMDSMFGSCNSLISLDISEWDTSAVTNINYMFSNCYSLTSLDVSGWDMSAVTSMTQMFYNCNSLTSLDVSGWDMSAVTSMNGMFNYCRGLHGMITLPASITVIGSSCFSGCRSLYEWHFLSTTPPTLSNSNAFTNMTDYGGKKIYVPVGCGNAYKTASNWSTWADYIYEEGE